MCGETAIDDLIFECNGLGIDFLTRLRNRYLFEQRIKQYIEDDSFKACGYIMLIDIDDLKMINSYFGYEIGDAFLKIFVEFLSCNFREGYELFRLNSDSFGIISNHSPEEGNLEDNIATIISRCYKPWVINGIKVHSTVCISATYLSDCTGSMEEIYHNLDFAMYEAKEGGRNNYAIYHEETELIADRLFTNREIEKKLREAVYSSYQGFELYYQPIHSLQSGKVIGGEALLRFIDEEGYFIPPDSFIPVAERTGLIVPIGKYVLRHSVALCRNLLERGWTDFHISVNLSVYQLQQPDFSDFVINLMKEYDVPHQNIVLEITEGLAATNIDRIKDTCQRLKEKGIVFALDDFGTGYSSLNMVKTMPLDIIKIDKVFVDDVTSDEYAYHFIKLMTELGHLMDLWVCVEGVEEESQLEKCRNMGVDLIQGHIYQKAIPQDAFIAYLKGAVGE